jgi:hypothetical protein
MLTDQQRDQFKVVMASFGQHRETMLAQAIAFENMPDKHMRNCGKHFHRAVDELDKGMQELLVEVAEMEKQPGVM